jgi:TonB family protein
MNKSSSHPIGRLTPLAVSVLLHVVVLNALIKAVTMQDHGTGGSAQQMNNTPMLSVVIMRETPALNQKAPSVTPKAAFAPKVTEKLDAQTSSKTTIFRPASELTRPPVMIANEPDFVALPWGPAVYGKILLRLSIDPKGKVSSLSIVESSMPAELEQQVRDVFQQAVFRPGEIRGIPVASSVDFMVDLGSDSESPPLLSQ